MMPPPSPCAMVLPLAPECLRSGTRGLGWVGQPPNTPHIWKASTAHIASREPSKPLDCWGGEAGRPPRLSWPCYATAPKVDIGANAFLSELIAALGK